MLNSKTRELAALQEEAARKMEETRRAFVDGMRVAKEVRSDLEIVHRKVRVLKQKTERKYVVRVKSLPHKTTANISADIQSSIIWLVSGCRRRCSRRRRRTAEVYWFVYSVARKTVVWGESRFSRGVLFGGVFYLAVIILCFFTGRGSGDI